MVGFLLGTLLLLYLCGWIYTFGVFVGLAGSAGSKPSAVIPAAILSLGWPIIFLVAGLLGVYTRGINAGRRMAK